MIMNALSIDLEDWFHPELVRSHVLQRKPERRVAWAVEPILGLLERYKVRATFFIVGDVLQHHPKLVSRLCAEGHEIGCHGWSHRPLWELAPERFAWELEAFDNAAQSVLSVDQIVGFRAPTFSLDERTAWALDILRAYGYRYDSSIFPLRTSLYGVADCPPYPYHPTKAEPTHDHAQDGLIEFPMTVYRLGDVRIPISGGFYLRALPISIVISLLKSVNAKGYPFVIYIHPWETDLGTPRLASLPRLHRWISYMGTKGALIKLEALLKRFSFAPLRDVLGIEGGRNPSDTAA